MHNSKSIGTLSAFITKMERKHLPRIVIDTFAYYYEQLVSGETGMIHNKDIQPVGSDEIEEFEELRDYRSAGENALKHSVRIVLNGGLGTSMGLTGPKSLIIIKEGQSFLDVILQQIIHRGVQPAIMNSFHTHNDTLEVLSKIKPESEPLLFQQHMFPKVLKHGLGPAKWSENPELEWNPPGHGDVYTALYSSKMLERLLDNKINFAFISNSDNLGASIDPSLLGFFSKNRFPFMMEVAQKTPADIKGGHLARHQNGSLILRESAQCPKNEMNAFQDIKQYRYFNTNNIWVNLSFLKDLLEKQKILKLPVIFNPKTLDPRNTESPEIIQIETAMGAAISLFKDAAAVNVPRSRFFPVKKCNDLLAVRSDCFVFSANQNLMINPKRTINTEAVKVKLDPEYFGRIDLFDHRFKSGIPSLVDCESLTVIGDVRFEGDIKISGAVRIENTQNRQAVIKEGSVIDKDLVF